MNENSHAKKKPQIDLKGLAHSLTPQELEETVPMVVGYALNELKLSVENAYEYAIGTICLSQAKNAQHEEKTQANETIAKAREWKSKKVASGLLIDASRDIVKKQFSTTPAPTKEYLNESKRPSFEDLLLRSMLELAGCDGDINEEEYRFIGTTYGTFTKYEYTVAEFAAEVERVTNQAIEADEALMDGLKTWHATLTEKGKEIIVTTLLVLANVDGKVNEDEANLITHTGLLVFKIPQERFSQIVKDAAKLAS